MPRARRTCNRCPNTTPPHTSTCPTCTTTADRARGTSTQRGYTSTAHRHFRTAVLNRDPICVLCHKAWSNTADHHPHSRRDLEAAGLNPNDPQYGRGLCHHCHSTETAHNQPGGWHATR